MENWVFWCSLVFIYNVWGRSGTKRRNFLHVYPMLDM
jgi:hypothetical protein